MRRWHDGYQGKLCSSSSQGVYAFSECALFLNIIYPIGKYALPKLDRILSWCGMLRFVHGSERAIHILFARMLSSSSPDLSYTDNVLL